VWGIFQGLEVSEEKIFCGVNTFVGEVFGECPGKGNFGGKSSGFLFRGMAIFLGENVRQNVWRGISRARVMISIQDHKSLCNTMS